ncbi:metalloregulator ArsR/SmtB family transcription factor [Spiroplasma endosymbiont of Labia minor]|uniref:ArsR/SmtB family transcription factor n=1 Tax=Spiroplasma endosymbiont of Labia minor TaxID=3066305 RepID=UPI0030D26F6E
MSYNYSKFANIFKTMSDPTRLKILEILSFSVEPCANDILKQLKITQPTLSYHLSILVEANIVIAIKNKQQKQYKINKSMFTEMHHFIMKIDENNDQNLKNIQK